MKLMKRLFTVAPILIATVVSSYAQTTLTFDTDTQGFIDQPLGDGSVTWSNFNGGSLQLAADGDFNGLIARLQLETSPLWADLQAANASGTGTLSFDFFVVGSDVTYSPEAPTFFNAVIYGQSDQNSFALIQNQFSTGLAPEDWPLSPDVQSFNYSLNIADSGADSDGNFVLNTGAGFGNLILGYNTSADVSAATVYVDNVSVNPIPEPNAFGLIAAASVALLVLFKRR